MANGQTPGWLDRWLLRFMPSPEVVAAAELKDAKLAILQSITHAEYAAMRVAQDNIATDYHRRRIIRLSTFLNEDRMEIRGVTVDVPKVDRIFPDIELVPRTEHG